MLCPQLPNKLSVFKYFMVVLLGFWLFYSCLSPEQEEGERCWKMTNAKITSIYIDFFFFSNLLNRIASDQSSGHCPVREVCYFSSLQPRG